MKKTHILTLIAILISSIGFAQTPYKLNYPDITIGNKPDGGKIVLNGSNLQFPRISTGSVTDSVLTIVNGVVKKVPRSQFAPASPSGSYIQANPSVPQNARISITDNLEVNKQTDNLRHVLQVKGGDGLEGYVIGSYNSSNLFSGFRRNFATPTFFYQDEIYGNGLYYFDDASFANAGDLTMMPKKYIVNNFAPISPSGSYIQASPTIPQNASINVTGGLKIGTVITGSLTDSILVRSSDGTVKQVSQSSVIPTFPVTSVNGRTGAVTGLQQDLKIVNVQDFGATGDGITNATTQIQNAINSLSNGGALYFPKGKYITTGGLIVNSAIKIYGDGEAIKVTTDPLPTVFSEGSVSIVNTSSSTNLFTVNSDGVSFESLTLLSNATTPTGKGILFNKANVMRMNNVGVLGFAINVDIVNGALWNILNCDFYNPTTYNLQVNFQTLPDGGDQSITNTNFYTGPRTGITHLNYRGGGGLKITASKFNQGGGTAALAKECIKLSNDVGRTVDFLVSNCSFENYTDRAINLSPVFQFDNIIINGNQFSATALNSTDVILLNSSLLYNTQISNNIIDAATNGINNISSNNTFVSGNMFGQTVTNRYAGQSFAQTLIPSKTSIGNLDATYNFNVYGENSKTVNSASTVMAVSSKDASANMGLFYRLKGGSTASSRYSAISSYENAFGPIDLILQDLGGNVGIDKVPEAKLDVNGVARSSTNDGSPTTLVRNTDLNRVNYIASGTGSATTISLPHGLTGVTSSSFAIAQAKNAASSGISYVTTDATNINIVYSVAPAAGTNNLYYSIEIRP